jgi:hypothetical protein
LQHLLPDTDSELTGIKMFLKITDVTQFGKVGKQVKSLIVGGFV